MNKLTFIALNDIHWRGANPEARTDNYMLALKAKLGEVAALAYKLDADGVLIAGDLVDVPGISLPVLTELDFAFDKIPCGIYAIAGQHDEWDHSPASLARAPFGHQARLEYIVDVAHEDIVLPIGHNKRVSITGRHYDAEVDTEGYYEPPRLALSKENTITIHLAHGLVLERSPSFEMKHTTLDKLKTSANILCVGDYHPGIGIQQLNNEAKTLVINPGALGRVKASLSDIVRPIQVAIIEVWENGEYSARLHTLQSAKPGGEVLSREKIEVEKARDDKVAEYLRLLQAGSRKNLNIVEMMEFIADKEGLSKPVKQEALKRLGIAREQIGALA